MSADTSQTILIVDDESFIRDMLQEFLEDQGYRVVTAANGMEGLARFKEHPPDIVVTDLAMPKMTGLKMLQELGPITDLGHSTIVLTGHGTDQDVEACYGLGVQNFLRKPVNLSELRGVVKRSFEIMGYAARLEKEMAEKKQALHRLQEQHMLLEHTFNLMAEGAVILDEGFQVRMVSRKAREIMKLGDESLKNKAAAALMGAEIAGPRGILAHCATNNRSAEYEETRILCPSGEVVPVTLSISPIIRDSKTSGWLMVFSSKREEERLQRERNRQARFGCMVGADAGMKKVFKLIEKVAVSHSNVLIRGESGTGKELAARELHERSRRAQKPFHAVNCAAISPDLLESEFFGHERGAFTGAHAQKKGRFEVANGGTLFLDEVGEIPLYLQGKLLRAIQEHRFERVGGTHTLDVDIRLVAATNRNLEQMIKAGEFREDLYYRLNVVPVHLPPLRERPGDILLLAESFIEELNKREQRSVQQIVPEAAQRLLDYHWPGNIRELFNVIEYAFAISDGDCIKVGNLPENLLDSVTNTPGSYTPRQPKTEKEQIMFALEETGFNLGQAAALLGMNRSTLYRKRKKYNI